MRALVLLLWACNAEDDAAVGQESAADTESQDSAVETGADDSGPADADGDGADASVDCDDTDPTVRPGADDAPCDGVDADCDGGLECDVDEDGHAPTDAGGDDCDDGNPWIHAGAEEWCDPVDHDCDGAPLAPGVCAKEQYIGAVWSTSLLPPAEWDDVGFGAGGPVGDLDGDSTVDWVSACGTGCAEAQVGVPVPSALVHTGGLVGRDRRIDMDAMPWLFGEDDCDYFMGAHTTDVGDTNGDGIPDLVLATGDVGSCAGKVWLVHGPIGDVLPQTYVYDAIATIWGHQSNSGFAENGLVSGDYDGDGLSDIAVGAPGVDELGSETRRVWILPGQASPELVQPLDDEPWTSGGESYGFALGDPGDVDGDGLDELVVAELRGWYLFEGQDVATAHGALAADVAAEVFPSFSTSDCFVDLGDLDGDGYPERGFGDTRDDTNGTSSGAIRVLSGLDRTRVGLPLADVATGSWIGSHAAESVGQGCWRTDVSGQPLGELAWDRNGGDDHGPGVIIAPLTGFPAPGTPAPSGYALVPLNAENPRALLNGFAAADYTGDGYDDIQYLGYSQVPDVGATGWVMVTGWAIPWDEPEWW